MPPKYYQAHKKPQIEEVKVTICGKTEKAVRRSAQEMGVKVQQVDYDFDTDGYVGFALKNVIVG